MEGKKEFSYRGKSIEELKEMNIREFAKLLKSNPRRAVLRQTDEIERFVSRSKKKQQNKKQIRTHFRDLIIVPQMVDMDIRVHNGKEFVNVEVKFDMIGRYLAEFAISYKVTKHGKPGIGASKGIRLLYYYFFYFFFENHLCELI